VSRRSCGLAIWAADAPTGDGWKVYGDASIAAKNFKLSEFLPLLRQASDLLANAVVVIDGPIGPNGMPTVNRMIDRACSRNGFRGRVQPNVIEAGSTKPFLDATYAVISALGSASLWFGAEPFPSGGAVHAETNPTVALALMIEQQPVSSLPSRSRPLPVPNSVREVRAKSDWYWALGGRTAVASALSVECQAERDHERVAALTCLSLAAQLAGEARDGTRAIAIGDPQGIYVVPEQHAPPGQRTSRQYADELWREKLACR
jgi:hypothetical protein